MGYANRIVQTEICALRSAHLPPLLQSQEAVGNCDMSTASTLQNRCNQTLGATTSIWRSDSENRTERSNLTVGENDQRTGRNGIGQLFP